MSRDAIIRRLAPTDRRSPTKVTRDMCPVGGGCYCCPLAVEKWHHDVRSRRTCAEMHPPADRECSLPYPTNIPPCPERETLQQEAPKPPAGRRPLRYEVCIDCGRITARRWNGGDRGPVAWCAGTFPQHESRG